MPFRVLLVANPTARSGGAAERIARVRERLARRGAAVDLLATLPDRGTVAAVREALGEGGYDAVVAAGGDGTIGEAAQGILAAGGGTPLGVVPLGTANNLAKCFGISCVPDELDQAVEVVLGGRPLALDVGRLERTDDAGQPVGEELFFDSVGWGLQARILAARNRDRAIAEAIPLVGALYRDELVYAGAAASELVRSLVVPGRFAARVRLDDGEERRYDGLTDLVVNATPVYAGSWVLDRRAEPDDGRFELVPVHGTAELAVRALSDLRDFPGLDRPLALLELEPTTPPRQAASFEVRLEPERPAPVAVQVDGEERPAATSAERFRIDVLPRALPLLVPADR